MLHKHTFVFHKLDFVKCKLLTNFEENFLARKNRMISKQVISETAVRRCSSKKLFLKIWQYSQENSCVSCVTLTQVFFCDYFEIFKSSFLHRIPPVATSVIYIRITKIEDHRC